LLASLSSYARKDITLKYQGNSENTGTIVLKPVKKTIKTYVSVDGKLMVEKRKVKSVTIQNVPKGNHKVQYTSESSWYQSPLDSTYSIQVDTAQTTTKIVKVPPFSTGYYIYQSALFVGSVVMMVFLF
jgi:hypothetical protein